jgi:predicted ATPase/DNA-binding winged helix-turn-helix (wHTH) protein
MTPPHAPETLIFGPFTLAPGERRLIRDGAPVPLGDRSLDILAALLSRPNEVVTKRELFARVWPDAVVEEGSLRFHIASLRKALGDGVGGARYISTVAGRGYCFVAPVARSAGPEVVQPTAAAVVPHIGLPSRLQRMVGRAEEVQHVSKLILEDRFVTIMGSGGIGKTTVAIAVGHELVEECQGAVLFVDLGSIGDAGLVATTLATMLGLSVQAQDAEQSLVSHLRDRRMLLIFDTCEHVVEAVAMLTSRIFAECPQVHLLATSREALRADGEHVFRLSTLPCPPDDPALTADVALTFPAIQLFLERARAAGAEVALDDADAGTVAGICRKLDGLALAIELAAGRVQTYGLRKTAELLDEHLTLHWPGRRTAPPRQRTLQATLDWSYELLTDTERTVLRRLAVFIGFFTFEAALQVATSESLDKEHVFRALESLIEKSLVSVNPLGAMMRYRLLDTTRSYALQIEVSDAERAATAERHALYFRRWLEHIGREWPTLGSVAERAPHMAALGNVRAALEWCFGPGGNRHIGVSLAAAAAPVFMTMSLLTECHRWVDGALSALDGTTRGGAEEMSLQSALGMSLMFTRGHGDAARDAFSRALSIAEGRDDAANQMLLLGPLHMFHFRRGEFRSSLQFAKRGAAAAAKLDDPTAIALAHCLTGISLSSMGELAAARAELEATLRHEPASDRSRTLHLGFDYYNWAGMALGRTLWMQGYPDQAIKRVKRTIEDAEALGHPVTQTIVLHWAAAVYLWTGDLESAETHIDWFLSRAETHSLGPYLAVGRGLKGELAIHRGDARAGVAMLDGALQNLHAARYELVSTAFSLALARGLIATGRTDEARSVIDASIRTVEANGDAAFMPELLRVKSQLVPETEPTLTNALELSRSQVAMGWGLRVATDLAAHLIQRGQPEQAQAILKPVLERFTEGFETADLKRATTVLALAR